MARTFLILLAVVGVAVVVPASSSHAQAPPLGTTVNFSVLAGTGITNTGNTVITGTAALPGDLGSATATIGGFPPGVVTPPGVIHAINDGPTAAALGSLNTAYNNLAGRTTTADLSGQNLGGLTLIPGVYNFSSTAQLTGVLNLNALGNPNAIFVFNIGSALTTASASVVALLNGAQGGNVFWRVGSSATLGAATTFSGDILAQTSITLTTGSTINCGAAWAETGAVTLDTNRITLCNLIAGTGTGTGAGVGLPLLGSLLLQSATLNQRAVANAIDNAIANGDLLPLAFLNLFNLSPADLGNALAQLSGESANGAAQAGTQAMNSFLSLVTNPFADNRGFNDNPPPPPLIYKAVAYKAFAAPDPRRWSIWTAAYAGQGNLAGNAFIGSNDSSTRFYGLATGIDYRVTPYTVAGFALAGGTTNYGLSGGLGDGRGDMFQAAVYSMTRVGAAYVSAAVAYGWYQESTDRILTVAGVDHLTANYAANSVGARIEGGYRFAIPGIFDLRGFGVTPYGALQIQTFHTPSYGEVAVSGSSIFALNYDAHTTTTTRTELGAWLDRPVLLSDGAVLSLRIRAAWAHDDWSDPNMTAAFQSLAGSSFTVIGATPAHDSLLTSGVAEISFRNGISLAGKFDSELAPHSQTYVGTVRLRYAW